MKKKISMLLVLSVLTVLLSSIAVSAQNMPEKQSETIFAAQERALGAYEKLWNSFEKDAQGEPIYPEDYAGAEIKDTQLVIYTTREDSEIHAKYLDICRDPEKVRIEVVRYSMQEIKKKRTPSGSFHTGIGGRELRSSYQKQLL